MRRVLIVGATSALAQAAARRLADAGERLFLVGRTPEKLDAVAADLRVRGGDVAGATVVDLSQSDGHEPLVREAIEALGGLDVVLVAHGVLGDQQAAEASYRDAEAILRTNFLSIVSLLTPVANLFEAQKSGTIAVISSVAGDRGRASNYVYGASKGGLDVFLDGLRHRLHASGVRVVSIRPGPVDTPMTAHMKKGPLMAEPDVVGRGIVEALDGGADVVYLPGIWRWIMLMIRSMPRAVFHRTKL